MTGVHVAVDGVGLARPRAGVGVYTTEILKAMAVDRPDCRFTVYVPPGVSIQGPSSASYRSLPQVPFLGRHVQWPGRLRRLAPDVFFGAAGALPLMDVGSPSVITVHDLAIYRNAGWFPQRQPLSTRWVIPSSLRRADMVIAVSSNTARDAEDLFGVPQSKIVVVPHGVSRGLRPIYNLAQVLAHPAWYEGFGLPPLEAMACGTPVVVSDSSSLPEVVDEAGLVVPAGDANAWRKALERVLGDTELAADLRRRGILRAAEFSWSRSAEMTWQVIDETLRE